MRSVLSAIIIVFALRSSAQSNEAYFDYTMQAQKSYLAKEYKKSASLYSKAFRVNSWKAFGDDRYNAARAWARSGNKDSAFYQLEKLVTLYGFEDFAKMNSDSAFTELQKDMRWKSIKDGVVKNIVSQEANMNSSLATLLDSVYRDHQRYRFEAVIIKNRHGMESEQNREIWKVIHLKDSVNLQIVLGILDKYGWLGTDVAGVNGNATLAMILLHAPLKIQENYLPMMRDARLKGKVEAHDLAAMEDKILLRQGKKQVYGTHLISFDGKKYYISPMEDPAAVDKRRAEAGLEKMNRYLSNFGMKWDLERYRKDQSFLEGKTISY
jgi:hypothetical protein